ncbi:MAG: trehalose-phosphatase, partial [Candidatus Zixiibacteriota bacterium]
MKILNKNLKPESFFTELNKSPKRVLMLDYDGTLAPFTVERNQAYMYPEVKNILDKILSSKKNRVIITSGRAVDNLRPLLKLKSLPEIWGCHGLERLTGDGKYIIQKLTNNVYEGFTEIERWIEENQFQKITEKKPSGFAFHWRSLPKKESFHIKAQITSKWLDNISSFNLALHNFDGGIEIRVTGINKGNIVKQIIDETNNDTPITYLGLDLSKCGTETS